MTNAYGRYYTLNGTQSDEPVAYVNGLPQYEGIENPSIRIKVK